MFGKRIRRLLSIASAVLLNLVCQGDAATIQAKSPSLVDVMSALALAREDDTVAVPAGTATWSRSLKVTKNITLQGAGEAATIIINEVSQDSGERQNENDEILPSSHRQSRKAPARRPRLRGAKTGRKRGPLIAISLAKDSPFRLTGFTFRGGTVSTQRTANGEIRISGNSHSFRIDHCTFDKLHGTNLAVSGFLVGVIDHCRVNLINEQPIHVNHARWNRGDHGNGSWADDPHWGSEKFVFIEDNVFENSGPKRAIDAYQGARFVVRYNQFHNCGLTAHGTEGQGRGAKQIEEYNNTYRSDEAVPAGQIRSGTLITHNNKWTKNVAKGHLLQVYRQFQISPHWGIAN